MKEEIINRILGYPGRIISFSKSGYRENHPNNMVMFNANIIVDGVKVWYGDLDITLDIDKLQEIADTLQKHLFILREMDARFGKEIELKEVLEKKAAVIINPQLKLKL